MTTSGSSEYAKFRRALRGGHRVLERNLPWIGIDNPWAVLVSEVMLQQTQTVRVVEPWQRFVDACPTPRACTELPLASVIRLWEGLGYHRRAKALHEAAKMIVQDFGGEVPRSPDELRRLPGVGDYTANAVASFAFGLPFAVLDTNVGRVLSRAIANRRLSHGEARVIAEKLRPRTNVALFNQSMLDLGAQFCRSKPLCPSCPVASACRWNKEGGEDPAPKSAGVSRPQSRFIGSDRQVRGRVLARLRNGRVAISTLRVDLGDVDASRLDDVVAGLIDDGLVERRARSLVLAGS